MNNALILIIHARSLMPVAELLTKCRNSKINTLRSINHIGGSFSMKGKGCVIKAIVAKNKLSEDCLDKIFKALKMNNKTDIALISHRYKYPSYIGINNSTKTELQKKYKTLHMIFYNGSTPIKVFNLLKQINDSLNNRNKITWDQIKATCSPNNTNIKPTKKYINHFIDNCFGTHDILLQSLWGKRNNRKREFPPNYWEALRSEWCKISIEEELLKINKELVGLLTAIGYKKNIIMRFASQPRLAKANARVRRLFVDVQNNRSKKVYQSLLFLGKGKNEFHKWRDAFNSYIENL
jgi:hypothetical protein